MRIFIGTQEICGLISLYAKELKRLGHTVTTFTYEKNRYYKNAEYDIVFSDNQLLYKSKFSLINRIVYKLNRTIKSIRIFFLVKKIAKQNDAVIYIWNSLQETNRDIEYFKRKGKKIIFLFVGSDVRHFNTFSKSYDVTQWKFPDYMTADGKEKYLQYIQQAETYGDLIYSVPDQAGLQSKPYYHLQIPIETPVINFKNNKRKKPKVLHLPSDPWKKGTDIIEATVDELIEEGVCIDFISMRDISNIETLDLLQDIDILVDEIVFHGPGVLAFEAMASGCAVATRYLVNSPDCFRPPLVNINAYNIKVELRRLFTDYDLQQELIINGRKYVEENNNSLTVVKNMINNLNNPRAYDYCV